MRRFQARHGLPPDGVLGKYTFAAMNIPANIRLGQLETNLVRLRSMSGFLGDRYVMVNIPAAAIEAVENGKVVQRHTAIVGKIDRQTPILNSKIHEVILNPYWTAPKSIIQKDIIPLMQQGSDLPDAQQHPHHQRGRRRGDRAGIDRLEHRRGGQLPLRQDPGKINAMASMKINFPNPHAVYMHDTPQQSLFGKIERFNSSGCVRVQNVRDLVTWLLRDTPGWNRQRDRAHHRDRRQHADARLPSRCRSISPTSPPGRRATASSISAMTSTSATASRNWRWIRIRALKPILPAKSASRAPPRPPFSLSQRTCDRCGRALLCTAIRARCGGSCRSEPVLWPLVINSQD